ncbi:MAG: hypothetical protein GQ564_14480 [Bacteroidales bacterium]|nr:hypothetical protein [Bacteroidales bacterium]
MKNKSKDKNVHRADLYFNILKECVGKCAVISDISLKLGISESDSAFSELSDLSFIQFNHTGGSIITLLPQGFSTYLSIASQKQTARQARVATYIAIAALLVSSFSIMASFIFN